MLEELKTIYRVQFPVLRQNEADTWYDQSGRIAFTNSKGLSGVGFSRPEWNELTEETRDENGRVIRISKGQTQGLPLRRTVTDDTLPDEPYEKTIAKTEGNVRIIYVPAVANYHELKRANAVRAHNQDWGGTVGADLVSAHD